MKRTLAILILSASLMARACAEDLSGTPDIVSNGLNAYLKSGAKAALDIWIKGSVRESDSETRIKFLNAMIELETSYGKMIGWELIRVVTITPSTRWVYGVAKFEKGPVWMSFQCYNPAGHWILPGFDLNTKASVILPPDLLSHSESPNR